MIGAKLKYNIYGKYLKTNKPEHKLRRNKTRTVFVEYKKENSQTTKGNRVNEIICFYFIDTHVKLWTWQTLLHL